MASETFVNEQGHTVTIRVSRDLQLPGIVTVVISAAGSSSEPVELALTPSEAQALRRLIVRQDKEARRHDRKNARA